MHMQEALPAGQSRSIQTRLVLPPDTNHIGTIFGGKVLSYIDEIAAIAAMKHSKSTVVTASIDKVDFLSPVKLGEILILEAMVLSTGRTSMEVYVKVESQNLETGERKTTTTALTTMVAVNAEGKPIPVCGVYAETEEEKHLFQSVSKRKDAFGNR